MGTIKSAPTSIPTRRTRDIHSCAREFCFKIHGSTVDRSGTHGVKMGPSRNSGTRSLHRSPWWSKWQMHTVVIPTTAGNFKPVDKPHPVKCRLQLWDTWPRQLLSKNHMYRCFLLQNQTRTRGLPKIRWKLQGNKIEDTVKSEQGRFKHTPELQLTTMN